MTLEAGHLERVSAARRALVELGVSVAELRDAEKGIRTPTFGEYLPVVIAAAGPGANRTYGTYWARMATLWSERRLDELRASDIEGMKNRAAATARSRRSTRQGRHSGEHVVAAARAVFNRAIADGLIDRQASPAHRVAKPCRLPNSRRALTAWELKEINTTAPVSGNDPVLDALLLRLHTENRLPSRWRPRHPTRRPRQPTLPGTATGERLHRALATHHTRTDPVPRRTRRRPRRRPAHRFAPALPRRASADHPTLRPAVEMSRWHYAGHLGQGSTPKRAARQ